MSRKVLGIDIRSQCISVVLLNSSLREHHVDDFLQVPFSGEDDPERSLSAALETVTEKFDLTGMDFVVSIPAHQFIFRNMQVPFHNSKKIRMVLPFELEPTLPFAVEDLAIDFHILNSAPAGEQTELIAAAIEKKPFSALHRGPRFGGYRPGKADLQRLAHRSVPGPSGRSAGGRTVYRSR